MVTVKVPVPLIGDLAFQRPEIVITSGIGGDRSSRCRIVIGVVVVRRIRIPFRLTAKRDSWQAEDTHENTPVEVMDQQMKSIW